MPYPPPPPSGSEEELQFAVAEPARRASPGGAGAVPPPPAGPTCAGCGRPIASAYYALADKVVCPACLAQIDAPPPGTKAGRVATATALGVGAGLLGAIVWYAIRRIGHVEIGLVAVLVGFLVGKAVRKGSGNRGGRGYQVLAVVLTYACIAANYMPDVYRGLREQAAEQGAPAAPARPHAGPAEVAKATVVVAAVVFGIALALPFLEGAKNLIGLLIIGFALWEAWKFNKRRALPITGPYQVGAAGVPAVVAAAPRWVPPQGGEII